MSLTCVSVPVLRVERIVESETRQEQIFLALESEADTHSWHERDKACLASVSLGFLDSDLMEEVFRRGIPSPILVEYLFQTQFRRRQHLEEEGFIVSFNISEATNTGIPCHEPFCLETVEETNLFESNLSLWSEEKGTGQAKCTTLFSTPKNDNGIVFP